MSIEEQKESECCFDCDYCNAMEDSGNAYCPDYKTIILF
jgi:hypothetical protein